MKKLLLLCLFFWFNMEIVFPNHHCLQAQNIPRPNINAPSGISVNSLTGNLFLQRSDLVIPGKGRNINFSFNYNSKQAADDYGFGHGWTCTYNMSYQIDGNDFILQRGDGRLDTFTLDSGTYTPPTGIFDEIIEVAPNQYHVVNKVGLVLAFNDPATQKITAITDRYGNTLTLGYTGTELSTITDAAGRTVSLSWLNGHLVEITDPNTLPVRSITYQYDADFNLIQVTDPMGNTTSYQYNLPFLITQMIDKNGTNYDIKYNQFNAVTQIISPLTDQSIVYDDLNFTTYLTEQINGSSQTTIYTFDTQLRLNQISGNCCGYNISYTYDTNNNVTTITDANGNTTNYSYDTKGNITQMTDALGNTEIYTYEPVFNQLSSKTDRNGQVYTFVHNALGNVTQINMPEGVSETYSYTSFGKLDSHTDANGNTTTYTYDTFGYVNSITDGAGAKLILTIMLVIK